MTPSVLTEYAQRHADEDILGWLILFCQREVTVSHAKVCSELELLGLEEWAPRRPADSDVFRRVATAAQRKRLAHGDDFVNIMVRDLRTSGDEIEKRIVTETIDIAGKRLDYREDYAVVYHKPSGTVGSRKLSSVDGPADDVAKEILHNFSASIGTVDSNALRAVVTRVLVAHSAISARPTGGVDFLPRSQASVVDRLLKFGTAVPGCWIHAVPLPDDDEQRPYLADQVTSETVTEIDRALSEMRMILSSGEEVSTARFATLNQTYKALVERADTYADLLSDNLDSTRARLSVYDRVMRQCMVQVKDAA